MAQESVVLASLAAADSYTIDGTHLTLTAPDGSGLDFIGQ
jgi:hypothetical protein